MADETPMTQSMLKVTEPMMLPIAMSVSPLRAAMTDAKVSGSDVPTATMVSPMMRSRVFWSMPRV